MIVSPDDGQDFETVEAFLAWLRTVGELNSGVTRLRISAFNKHTGKDVESPEATHLPLELLLPELEATFEAARRYRSVLEVARDVSSIIRGDIP